MGLKDGKCEECVAEGERSEVVLHSMTTTCMSGSPARYDADGVYQHAYDPNTTTKTWRCSRGHTSIETCGPQERVN